MIKILIFYSLIVSIMGVVFFITRQKLTDTEAFDSFIKGFGIVSCVLGVAMLLSLSIYIMF